MSGTRAETRAGPPGRLALRLGAHLLAGSALVLAAGGYWNLRLERAHLTSLVSASAERIAETIRRSTRDAMLRDDAAGVRRTLDNVGAQPGIERIRVFNKEGRIRCSTRPEEVARLVDVRAEQCYGCHQQGQPLTALPGRDRVRVFEAPDGGRVLGVIAPIHNEPQCLGACHAHSAGQSVLGVLDVQLSLDAVDAAVSASQRQLGVALAVTLGAMALLSASLAWRLVLRPLRAFHAAIAAVEPGAPPRRVALSAPDEIGDLARAWNAMTAELERARAELQERNRGLETRVRDKTAQLERAHECLPAVEKMASLGKLAAIVAHEINNPLAGIRTFARLLLRRAAEGVPDDAAETRRMLELVESEAARCGDVVRNLLAFGRVAPARFAPADLAPLAQRCAALLRHKAELAGVTLEVELPARLPLLECDAAQIEQLLLALVVNALEATPAGGGVRVRAAAHEADALLAGRPSLVIEVADTGSGIAPEHRARVFEPFFTTKEAGKGAGLGLAVVYGIVGRHGGQVDFESRPGEGTLFRVRLPREHPADAAPDERAP